MEQLDPTEFKKISQKGNIHRMGDWDNVAKSKPSNISFTPIKPNGWQKNFPFVGYDNQLTNNGNLNISSISSAVIKMKSTDTNNPILDKLFTNQQNKNSASVIENTTHGIDFSRGRNLSGIASGGFSSCAFQATWASKGEDHYLLVSHIQSFSPLKSLLNQYELTLKNVSRVLTIVNPNGSSIQDQAVDSTFTQEEKRSLDSKSVYWVKYQTIFPGAVFGGFAFDRVIISFLPQNLKHRLWLACAEGALGSVVTSVLAYSDDMQKYTQHLFNQNKLSDVKEGLLQQHILDGDFGDHSRIFYCIINAPQKQGLQHGSSAALMKTLSDALLAGDGATWQRTLGGNSTKLAFYQSQDNPQF